MASREVDLLARDLVRLLGDLSGLHGEMAMHMRGKLEAVKAADAARIQSITARETLLADRAAEREGLRRQLTARMVKVLGMPEKGADARPITLSQLAEQLDEPRRSQLLVAAAGLREKVQDLNRLQRTISLVTSHMLEHLGEVLKVMCTGVGGEVYSRSGRREHAGAATVFEAVG